MTAQAKRMDVTPETLFDSVDLAEDICFLLLNHRLARQQREDREPV
jgi:hypothetical protein